MKAKSAKMGDAPSMMTYSRDLTQHSHQQEQDVLPSFNQTHAEDI